MTDQLQRFLFDDFQIRGEIAHANDSFNEIVKNHDFTPEVANVVGELLVATTLLTAMLKFEGKIAVQLQGDGPLKMAVINADQNLQVRGTARVEGETAGLSFSQLVGKGHMMITITPDDGERYQGIVDLNNDSLSSCLENYFQQSEQLPTRVILHAGIAPKAQAAGILIQTLPASSETHEEDFQHVCALAHTVKAEELYDLTPEDLLFRLYHQETVRLFDTQPITYKCSCSKERCLSSLASIAPEEINELIKEHGAIEMHCEYCASDYRFEVNDLQILLGGTDNQQH
ncbi:Hsp33 family molecular chaperone HslO [Psychromonas sp. psych-6C06]|uniref:Hsp33 family molecular chaperone HslO n=1 Tax=Psychromonas sp. psych-6C06 TaxID=2058089 RepID=UPI00187BF0F8|nr:Hsp33 family molecular chaperone HslO [Psychromonas sp. psych-6C06]